MRHASGLPHRPEIEGLRAVAVVIVLVYHARLGLSGGFTGVDVFFVISGFLITRLLAREWNDTGRIALATFWARRARRLLPAATLVTIAALIADSFLGSPLAGPAHAKTAITVAAYASNIGFAWRNSDYFGSAGDQDPLLHTWSLAVEEQYYLAFAPIVAALAANSLVSGVRHNPARLRAVLLVALVASLALHLVLSATYPIAAFYAAPARAWEFCVGGLVATIPAQTVRAAVRWKSAGLTLGAVMLALGAIGTPPLHGIGSAVWLIGPVVGTATIILLAPATESHWIVRLLSSALLVYLGNRSYSVYLWHWPIITALDAVIPRASVGMRAAACLAAVGLMTPV